MTKSFPKKALVFLNLLREQKYPNSVTLGRITECSRNTAVRVINRLRDEYGAPIEYDQTEKGYYLKDPDYQFDYLPPGKDEFTAILLLRELTGLIDSEDLQDSVDLLWNQLVKNNQNLNKELSTLNKYFSSDLTQLSILADTELLTLVNAAASGDPVEITYRSPWKHQEPKKYQGKIIKVYFSDGALYVFFHEVSGRGLVLHASFIKNLEILKDNLQFVELPTANRFGNSMWLEGFGIWASESLEIVEITIYPPAAEYYAAQIWHEDQEDNFDVDGNLVRKFPSMLSPEIVRRVLSLGKYVKGVRPEELNQLVEEQVKKMLENLSEDFK